MKITEYHTFLSHNSDDKPAVELIAHQLQKEGINPWLDKWNLIPGNSWQEEIEESLQHCATCCVFLSPSGIGPWQNAEMRAAINQRITKGNLRVIPVLLPGAKREQRSRYPAFLAQTTWVEYRDTLADPEAFRRLIAGIRGIAPGPDSQDLWDSTLCPYRGLQVFDIEHARFFFGREALTEWTIEALRSQLNQYQANRFLAIIGSSGSGKSSLARAGLVPALMNGELPGSENWPVVILKPGHDPIESLAVALKSNADTGADVGDVGDVKRRLATEQDRLHLQSRLSLGERRESDKLIVLVDQFEEVFTLCNDEDTRQAFINNLLYAATDAVGQTIVLITMRADFYGKCAGYDELAKTLSDNQVLIGPMSEQELRDAIMRPAQLAGSEFEPGLVEILIEDVKSEAGALPLLEYALTQLWSRSDDRRLTVETYNSIGKLEGAVERRANEIYGHLNPAEKEICKQIFLRLTQPGEGTEDTKRRALRSEMGDDEHIEKVLKTLTDERLITTEGRAEEVENLVEVSHEALIRSWSRLRQWIDENRDDLRIQTRLTNAAHEWSKGGISYLEDFVYRGARLEEATEWASKPCTHLSTQEQAFLEASVAFRDQQTRREIRRQRRVYLTIASSVLILGAVISFIILQYRDVQRSNQELAQMHLAKEAEVARNDISGALTVFGTSYGGQAYEVEGRGLFTSLMENKLFDEYTNVAAAVAQAQKELEAAQHKQRAEVLSSLNGKIFLKPRNVERRFFALVVGTNEYENNYWAQLSGAVADASSIHEQLQAEKYDSTLLVNPRIDELRDMVSELIGRATLDCKHAETPSRTPNGRGLSRVETINVTCDNVVIFIYFAGHGFVLDGVNYIVPSDAKHPRGLGEETLSNFLNVDRLKARMAEQVAIQIIIADVSRSVLRLR